jgi:hypothetical protein
MNAELALDVTLPAPTCRPPTLLAWIDQAPLPDIVERVVARSVVDRP